MRLAFSKPTANEDEQRLLFARFRQVGYAGLQLKGGQFLRYIEQPERFRAVWGDDLGAVSALIFGGRLDEDGIVALRRLLTFARSVQSERIVFCLSVPRAGLTKTDIRGFARTLSELGDEAQQNGHRLSLHHHYDQPVMYREDFDVFFEVIRAGTVGLTVDTAHLVKSGIEDIGSLILDFSAVIDNIHLKDFADDEFRVLGQGRIDFAPVFTALRQVGYDGWLCADEESGSDLRQAMEACYRFMERGWKETKARGDSRSVDSPGHPSHS